MPSAPTHLLVAEREAQYGFSVEYKHQVTGLVSAPHHAKLDGKDAHGSRLVPVPFIAIDGFEKCSGGVVS